MIELSRSSRIRASALLAAGLAMAACGGPFNRGTVDNRDPDRVAVVEVAEDGRIELDDGRTVRLFGLIVPPDPERREHFLAEVRQAVGEDVTVHVVLPGDVPAVELDVWTQAFICGNGLRTWDPTARPFDEYHRRPMASNLAVHFEECLRESDLDHPDAEPRYVNDVRHSHAYGIQYRSGEAP